MQPTSDFQVLNFGSLNIDRVYHVDHFVAPKETLACSCMDTGAGGKGLNQSIALARAGIAVAHAGKIGPEGDFLLQTLQKAGVDTHWVFRGATPTGHAIIQVDPSAQNSILLFPGANAEITPAEILEVLCEQPAGRWLLLQNEISNPETLMREAKSRGMKIAMNPAPCTPEIKQLPLELLDLLVVNEVEASQLTGAAPEDTDTQTRLLRQICQEAEIIITLGSEGAIYSSAKETFRISAVKAKAVDTTSAGDTFIGYFMAAKLRGLTPQEAMQTAARASAITVSSPGAADSIPAADEIFH